MRGFPLLNLLIALLLFGAVLWPLVHHATKVTPAIHDHGPVAQTEKITAGISSRVSLRLVHAAQSIRLLSENSILHDWRPAAGELLLEDSISMPMNDGRSEFTVQIEWPAGTPDTVAELRVEPDGLPARTANVWSSGGTAEEVMALSWKGDAP